MNTYDADAGPCSELGGTGLRRSFLRVTHMPSLHLPGGLNFDPPGSIMDRFITARTRTSHGGVVVLDGCDAIAIHDLCDWNRTP